MEGKVSTACRCVGWMFMVPTPGGCSPCLPLHITTLVLSLTPVRLWRLGIVSWMGGGMRQRRCDKLGRSCRDCSLWLKSVSVVPWQHMPPGTLFLT